MYSKTYSSAFKKKKYKNNAGENVFRYLRPSTAVWADCALYYTGTFAVTSSHRNKPINKLFGWANSRELLNVSAEGSKHRERLQRQRLGLE